MYHVYILTWDDPSGKNTGATLRLLSVAKTPEHADDLVDDYSEKYPHAYIDWEKV